VLVSAGVVAGRKIACPRDMSADVTNAGGRYVAAEAVQDGPLVTSVYFGYLPQYMKALLKAISAR
jgi:putative intracellular protease/amidase